MAAFNKFDKFVLNLGKKVFNLNSDSLKIALSNVAPGVTNNQLSDITEIAYTNLPTSRVVANTGFTQTAGTGKLVGDDMVLTATGGSVATFRYVILYDDTAANDELIGYWDYGSGVNLVDTQTFTIDFDGANGILTIM